MIEGNNQEEGAVIGEGRKNVFEVEWRGKADILDLRIETMGRFPLKIYEQNYFL